MTKNLFINEQGNEAYELPCGCSGEKISTIGWINTLCSACEDELQESLEMPLQVKKTKMRPNREI